MNSENWSKRAISGLSRDSMYTETVYLPVYSEIYNFSEKNKQPLTVTVSIRNTSETDSVYVDYAKYFDTKGKLIRTYFDKTIYLSPMETVEIVVDEKDVEGGTGANFMFSYKAEKGVSKPLIQAVMVSSINLQGVAFVTNGIATGSAK